MRRLILIVAVVVVAGAAAAAGWHFLKPHDKMADARQLMRDGNLRGAQLVLRSVVQDNPERAEAHLRLAQIQLRLGDPVAAEKELGEAGSRGGDEHVIRPLLAQSLLAQRRDADVLARFTPDGLDPEQAAAVLVARAEAQLVSQQPDAAADSVAQAQKLAPRMVEVAMAAARVALVRRDAKAAEQHVEEALAIDPKALEPLMLQGELRAARGDRQGALASYDTALGQAQAAGPGAAGGLDAIRLARAGVLIAQNEDARARDDVDTVLKADARSPLANYMSAQLLARARDWQGADRALSAVGPALTRLPRADLLVALVKANVGEPEQAVAAAERQVARNPLDLPAAKLLARLDLSQNRPQQAAEVMAGSVAALDKAGLHADAEALDLMAGAYASTGQPDQALAALQQASALAPDDARLLTRLASLQLRRGDASQATSTLERALDLTPETPAPPAATAPAPAATTTTATAGATPAANPGAAPAADALPSQAQTAAALVVTALQAGEIERAATALERLHQAHGEPVQTAMLTGMVRLAQVDLNGARTAFEEAIRLSPGTTPARVSLARVLALQGHETEAADILEKLVTANRTDIPAMSALANLRLAQNKPEAAIAAAEAAHAAAPANTGVTIGLADLYTRTGQPAKALALLDAVHDVSATDPATGGLLAARIRAQVGDKQLHEAAATASQLLERTPDNVALRRETAELRAADHDFEGARSLLRDGLASHPGDPVLLAASVAVASREGGADAALAQAQTLARDPANAAARPLQGDVLMGAKKYAEAGAAYQAALASLPADTPLPQATGLVVRAAQAEAAAGDATRAATLLRDWLGRHPDSAEAALTLSSFDIGARRLDDARTHLQTVLKTLPNNGAALNNLAWVMQQQGDLAQARALSGRAYLLAPTPQAADTLGWVVLAQDRVPEAVALLREAATALPGDPTVGYHYAAALARDGQKDAARTTLKAVLAKAPAFDEKPAADKLARELASP